MRIGIFASRVLPKLGGAELVVDNLARRFHAAGHQVVVIAPRPGWLRWPDDRGLPYAVFRYPPHLSKRFALDLYGRYLRAAYAKHRFEFLHCHDVLPQAYLAVCARPEIDVPIVLTSHGSDVMATHSRYKHQPTRARAVQTLKSVDAVIAVSDTMKENILELCPEGAPVVEISNGVELKDYREPAPRPQSLAEEIVPGRYLLYLGRLTARKGVDTLLEALAGLKPTNGVELVVAGYGREEPRLRELADRLGLTNRVRFVGAVAGAAKRYLLQHAVVTIIPTKTWEACSLVALESFAAGTPVIGSSIQGVRHLVLADRNGMQFDPGDSQRLRELLELVRAEPQRVRRWGSFAKEHVRDFDWDVIAARHLELYSRLIAGQGTEEAAEGGGKTSTTVCL